MIVSFIEEERIRKQLKNLMEDDEKRKKGVFAVLKRDKRLAKGWVELNDNYSYRDNLIVVNQVAQMKKVKSKLGPKMVPVIDAEQKPLIKPKPTVKRLIKQTNAIQNINASLEAYNSRTKTNNGIRMNTSSLEAYSCCRPKTSTGARANPNTSSSGAGLTRSSHNHSGVAGAIKSQPTDTTKKKPLRKTLPRSNYSLIDKSHSKFTASPNSSPSTSHPPASPTAKKVVNKKSISVSVTQPAKPPVSSNAKFKNPVNNNNMPIPKPQVKSAKPMIQHKNLSGVTGSTLPNSMGLSKPMLPQKSSKITERTLPHTNKSGGKVTNKKSLKSNHSVNVEAKEKPFSGRSRQKLATASKPKPINASGSKKLDDEYNSALQEIGKVKAIVAKIKSLSSTATLKPEETKVKRKVTPKRIPKVAVFSSAKLPPGPPPRLPEPEEPEYISSSTDDDFTLQNNKEVKKSEDKNDNNAKDEKSNFNFNTKQLQDLILEQSKAKKAKLDPKYYSMRGFFGERNDMYGIPDMEDNDSDVESMTLYSDDVSVSSNYTVHEDHDISSNDDSLMFDNLDLDDTDETNDPDYELPHDVVEDLVIHKGTASIRDLVRDENKIFDSDDDETKIVEIPSKKSLVRVIKQPKAYRKEELMKLTVYTTAASSSQIRKRHLALKSENNDLQSQKSVSKMSLRDKKKANVTNINSKSKSRFELVKEKETTTTIKEPEEELEGPHEIELLGNYTQENLEEKQTSSKSVNKFEWRVNKTDSCPLLSFTEINKQSDFGIPTIRSAEPKFNIFKSQDSMDNVDDEAKVQDSNSEDDEKEICPQLVTIRNEVLSSKTNVRPKNENGKNISSSSSDDNNNDSDTNSLASVDVNQKYLYTIDDCITPDEEMPEIPIAVIDATQCPFESLGNETQPDSIQEETDTSVTYDRASITDVSTDSINSVASEVSNVLTNDDHQQVSEKDEKISNIEATLLYANSLEKARSTNPFEDDDDEDEQAGDANAIDDDEMKDVATLRESCQSLNHNCQMQTKRSTNPFEDEDLITFSDDLPPPPTPSALKIVENARQSNNNGEDNNEKDELCVDNLVNNNLNRCIMYSIQTPITLKRVNLGENDFQFVRYAPQDEPDSPDIPATKSNSTSSSSDSVAGGANGSDHDNFDNYKNIRDNRVNDMKPVNPEPKIQRKEYLNVHINSLVSRKVLLLLRNPVYIYGTVKLTVLVGNIEVFGCKAGPGENLEIFSPKGFSLLQITPLCNDDLVDYEEDYLRECLDNVKDHFTTLDLRNIRRFFVAKTDAIIVLHRNQERAKLTQNFKLFMNENVFPKIKSFNSKPPFGGSEHLLKCRILPDTDQALKIPLTWSTFAITTHKRVIVAGGKGVGKSTFIRYVINKHLPIFEKILLIDLDIGQPEIFLPQTVSFTVIKKPLLGPGFFLNKQPHKAYVVGHTNVVMCPMVYKNAVKSLITECQTNEYLKDMPWMINTMGYNKGFGAELMAMITELIQPTDMVQIESSSEINNFDIPLNYLNLIAQVPRFIDDPRGPGAIREIMPYTLHKFPSVTSHGNRHNKSWAMSAKDIRYSMVVARLSDALYGEAQMLSDCKPLWINFHKIHLYNAVTNFQNKSELLRTVEGNLVYLGSFIDEAKPIECYGIGVVRAVDFQSEKIYLVPAMPYEYMYYVNCLVIGEMCLPAAVFKNQGYKITDNVPFVFETDDDKGSRAIKQIFHRPSEFFLGSKQSFEA